MYVAPETVSILALCAWSASWRRTGAAKDEIWPEWRPVGSCSATTSATAGGDVDPDLDRAELGVDHRAVDGRRPGRRRRRRRRQPAPARLPLVGCVGRSRSRAGPRRGRRRGPSLDDRDPAVVAGGQRVVGCLEAEQQDERDGRDEQGGDAAPGKHRWSEGQLAGAARRLGDERRRGGDRDGEAEALGVGRDGGVDADDPPVASRSGPPLLPGLIAASVWSRPVSVSGRPVASSRTVMVRPVADRMPLVTVSVNVPSGLPMAMTVWPTWSVDTSPMMAGVRPVASILTRARSLSRDSRDDRGVELLAVGELDRQRLAARHDVLVGQDVAVCGQDDARADAGRRDVDEAAGRNALRGDRDDRVAHRGDDCRQVGRGAGAGVGAGGGGHAGGRAGAGGGRRLRRPQRARDQGRRATGGEDRRQQRQPPTMAAPRPSGIDARGPGLERATARRRTSS